MTPAKRAIAVKKLENAETYLRRAYGWDTRYACVDFLTELQQFVRCGFKVRPDTFDYLWQSELWL